MILMEAPLVPEQILALDSKSGLTPIAWLVMVSRQHMLTATSTSIDHTLQDTLHNLVLQCLSVQHWKTTQSTSNIDKVET